MAQRTLKEQLEEAEQHSKEVLDQLLDENTTRDEFRTLMKSYVGYRFFLEPEEMKTDVILDLAEDSVEKLLSINDLSVTLSEGSQTSELYGHQEGPAFAYTATCNGNQVHARGVCRSGYDRKARLRAFRCEE